MLKTIARCFLCGNRVSRRQLYKVLCSRCNPLISRGHPVLPKTMVQKLSDAFGLTYSQLSWLQIRNDTADSLKIRRELLLQTVNHYSKGEE